MAEPAPLMLSVSGLRGIVGASLTPEVAARFGGAVAGWARAQRGAARPRLVLGRDSRPSGPALARAACAGATAAGAEVLDAGLVATPTLAVAVDHLRADAGIMVTASHNPAPWNGLKPLAAGGVAPPAADSAQIIGRFEASSGPEVDMAGGVWPEPFDGAGAIHIERVLGQVEAERIRAAGLRVVLDSACGAGGPVAARLLDALGVAHENLAGEPTGDFPHPPEPVREHLGGLCEAVARRGADLGLAQDPDADRLAIVDAAGRYLGEEYTLVLGASRLLARHGRGGAVVTNLSTSRMIDDLAARHAARVIRTPVGEAHVAAAMAEAGAVAGGEGNGGLIVPGVSRVRDSLAAMALILEGVAACGRPVGVLADELGGYAMEKAKQAVGARPFAELAHALEAVFRDAARVDRQDGIRFDWPEAWLHVRPSNTEPIVRLIAEAPDRAQVRRLMARAGTALEG